MLAFTFNIVDILFLISYCSIDIHLQKKFDTNQIQCTQLLLYNEELKTKCQLLQNKLDDLERSNVHLIERLTQKVEMILYFK
jgi:predicted nuclease with TOPRIM domain